MTKASNTKDNTIPPIPPKEESKESPVIDIKPQRAFN